ncbi:MAG: ribonucleotide reductase subunit alpha [Burkholderiales bacterium]|nr:MAG: ribonucleotide reductase subunit alpha [Burkholderiales bacterium]
MNITTFDELLAAARTQAQPQRLLFVLAGIELPEDASPQERAGFERGEGGALVPRLCVDKSPDELADFAQFSAEAATLGVDWGMVFAAALSGQASRPPAPADVDTALNTMVERIRQGQIGAFLPFDRQGHAVRIG